MLFGIKDLFFFFIYFKMIIPWSITGGLNLQPTGRIQVQKIGCMGAVAILLPSPTSKYSYHGAEPCLFPPPPQDWATPPSFPCGQVMLPPSCRARLGLSHSSPPAELGQGQAMAPSPIQPDRTPPTPTLIARSEPQAKSSQQMDQALLIWTRHCLSGYSISTPFLRSVRLM